jgi:hypothetical protein
MTAAAIKAPRDFSRAGIKPPARINIDNLPQALRKTCDECGLTQYEATLSPITPLYNVAGRGNLCEHCTTLATPSGACIITPPQAQAQAPSTLVQMIEGLIDRAEEM